MSTFSTNIVYIWHCHYRTMETSNNKVVFSYINILWLLAGDNSYMQYGEENSQWYLKYLYKEEMTRILDFWKVLATDLILVNAHVLRYSRHMHCYDIDDIKRVIVIPREETTKEFFKEQWTVFIGGEIRHVYSKDKKLFVVLMGRKYLKLSPIRHKHVQHRICLMVILLGW